MLKRLGFNIKGFGFTMIEILVAVAVIGMLSGVGVRTVKQQIDKGRDAKRKSDVYKLTTSFEEYYNDHGCFPTNTEWESASCEDGLSDLSPYLDNFPCDPTTKEKYTYQTTDKDGEFCDGTCGECYGYRILARLANQKDKDIIEIGCDADSCGVENPSGKNPNWGLAMRTKVPVPGFIPGQGEDVGHTEEHDCQHSKDPDCEEPSPLPSPSPGIKEITIKGRFVDYFTHEPIPTGYITPADTGTFPLIHIPTNSDGEFSFKVRVDDLEQMKDDFSNYYESSKLFYYHSSCYITQSHIKLVKIDDSHWYRERFVDSELIVYFDPTDEYPENFKWFAVDSSEIDIGDLPMWPTASNLDFNSDIEVMFQVNYQINMSGLKHGMSHKWFDTCHTLRDSYWGNYIPLDSPIRIQLEDKEGNRYYSPDYIVDRSNGCHRLLNVNFSNGVFTTEPDTIKMY